MKQKVPFGIHTKILLSYATALVLTITVALVVFRASLPYKTNYDEVQKTSQVLIDAMHIKLRDEAREEGLNEYALSGDAKDRAAYSEVGPRVDRNGALASVQDADDVVLVEKLQRSEAQLDTLEEQVFALIDAHKATDALRVLRGSEYRRWEDYFSDAVERLVDQKEQQLGRLTDDRQAIANRVMWVWSVSIVAYALVGIVVALTLAHYIIRPLRSVEDAVDQIAGGDLHVRAEVQSNDEIGRLAIAFNRMAHTLDKEASSEKRLEEITRDIGMEDDKTA